mmetsp:Transcript_8405/g.22447  ORF Transcript_8405/g.22447 Transcript_8405/m.22447 type:complete len:307 (-) Transcript_8405:1088-2008(-)
MSTSSSSTSVSRLLPPPPPTPPSTSRSSDSSFSSFSISLSSPSYLDFLRSCRCEGFFSSAPAMMAVWSSAVMAAIGSFIKALLIVDALLLMVFICWRDTALILRCDPCFSRVGLEPEAEAGEEVPFSIDDEERSSCEGSNDPLFFSEPTGLPGFLGVKSCSLPVVDASLFLEDSDILTLKETEDDSKNSASVSLTTLTTSVSVDVNTSSTSSRLHASTRRAVDEGGGDFATKVSRLFARTPLKISKYGWDISFSVDVFAMKQCCSVSYALFKCVGVSSTANLISFPVIRSEVVHTAPPSTTNTVTI